MPTRTYTRKTDPNGKPADPALGNPSFQAGILTALPGRTWRTNAGTDVAVDIDGADLTPQEDADLTAAHTAWVPTSGLQYSPVIKKDLYTNGRIQRTEWFQNDEGSGVYSGLAQNEVYNWQGSRLISSVLSVLYTDGTVKEQTTTVYTTTDDGGHVVKDE